MRLNGFGVINYIILKVNFNNMGVITTADEKIKKAKDLISEAYKELLIVLDEDTWGHDTFTEEYIDQVEEVTMTLLKLKRKL